MISIPSHGFSGYGKALRKAWQLLWQRPIVFLPILYGFIVIIVLSQGLQGIAKAAYGEAEITDIAIRSIIAFALLTIITWLAAITHIMSLQASVLRKVATDKSIKALEAFSQSAKIFKRCLTALLALATIAIPLLALLVADITLFSLATGAVHLVLAITLAIIIMAASIMYGAWFTFFLPLVAYNDLGAWRMIGEAWNLLWKDAGHVWTTYAISFAAAFAVVLITLSISFAIVLAGKTEQPLWWSIISFVINTVFSSWIGLFIFTSYAERYKPKER